jgi:hypothetical protein
MKFIARHLNLIGLLLLASFASAAVALYFQVPERIQSARATTATAPVARYACPMHPKITSATPTDCPECGMKLVGLSGDKPVATETHNGGCCAEKPAAVAPPPAVICPHLVAQAAQPAPAPPADSCCPKPANP